MEKFTGIENPIGSYSCYINVVLQALIHLPSFVNAYQAEPEHEHPAGTICLKCELRDLLYLNSVPDISELTSKIIRKCLDSVTFHRLLINQMGCATEAFEEILKYLHREGIDFQEGESQSATAQELANDSPCTPLCLAHKVFGYQACDAWSCSCNDDTEIENPTQDMILRVYVEELRECLIRNEWEEALLKCVKAKETNCNKCGHLMNSNKLLIEAPKVLAISLIWNELTSQGIEDFLLHLSPVLDLSHVFTITGQNREIQTRYILRGFICFSLGHYFAFVWNLDSSKWIKLDDTVVRDVENWETLCNKMVRGKMTPILILYESAEFLDTLYNSPCWKESEYISLAGLNWGTFPHTHSCQIY
ncbi:unnamed protein product [Blepharisma stoltei]|uniref:USP domain-containing protein n=1 Tax=Blepharisma stoltei TaxID=1481888 RepID=A0AAU9ITJ3_9CILI|nr:unnamed protein product [Blepharisma stoltei]